MPIFTMRGGCCAESKSRVVSQNDFFVGFVAPWMSFRSSIDSAKESCCSAVVISRNNPVQKKTIGLCKSVERTVFFGNHLHCARPMFDVSVFMSATVSKSSNTGGENRNVKSAARTTKQTRRNGKQAKPDVLEKQEQQVFFDGLSYPVEALDLCTTNKTFQPDNSSDDCVVDVCSNTAFFEQRVDDNFVDTFRMSSPYIHAHSGRVFVVHLPGSLLATDEDLFGSVMQDLALMRIVGIKLVLVLGPKDQIDQRLVAEGIVSRFINGTRVTDETTLQIVKESAGSMLFEVEGMLSRGVVNMPSSSRISTVSGSFYSAQPVGVIGGNDFGLTGRVRKVDVDSIHRRLDQGDIVVLRNLGYSATGQLFNCQSEEVAGVCAAALLAEKLIFMTDGESIYDKRVNRPIPNLTLSTACSFLESQGNALPSQFRLALKVSVDALNKGVTRAHLLNRWINGVLLMEVFHRDGVGLMISRDLYEGIRFASHGDIAGISAIIKPLEDQGVLVKRGKSAVEQAIDKFVVIERDGMIIACLSLTVMPDDNELAELGCLAVHPDYRKLGKGDALLGFTERYAFAQGIRRLFVLSTVSFQWFLERGFSELSVDELPESKKSRYDNRRKSKIFVKALEGSRAVDEAEILKHL